MEALLYVFFGTLFITSLIVIFVEIREIQDDIDEIKDMLEGLD